MVQSMVNKETFVVKVSIQSLFACIFSLTELLEALSILIPWVPSSIDRPERPHRFSATQISVTRGFCDKSLISKGDIQAYKT